MQGLTQALQEIWVVALAAASLHARAVVPGAPACAVKVLSSVDGPRSARGDLGVD